VQIEELPNAELLQQGYANMEKARGLPPEESEGPLRKARYLALYFTMEAPNKEDAVPGLILLGEAKRVEAYKS
jgi:hypothetical protein